MPHDAIKRGRAEFERLMQFRRLALQRQDVENCFK
jgi:hypothetical protein